MKNLYTKLLKIQAEIKPIEKDSQNPHFKNWYFDISGLLAAVKPILTKHGIVLVQPIMVDEHGQKITTILADSDSEDTLTTEMRLPELTDPQKLGAVISYYRRYALTSLLALEGEDTDANDTATKEQAKVQPSPIKSATGGKERACGICSTSFTPTAQYPYAKYCSAKCGAEAKLSKPVQEPVIDRDETPFG